MARIWIKHSSKHGSKHGSKYGAESTGLELHMSSRNSAIIIDLTLVILSEKCHKLSRCFPALVIWKRIHSILILYLGLIFRY